MSATVDEIESANPRGWTPDKVSTFKAEFFKFLDHITVNSKELGPIRLGDHVYRAQRRFLDGIFNGLAEDKHDFKSLKSRQLGVSTISRALTLFWIGVHAGMKGYMVFDTDGHKEEARLELIGMIKSLPTRVKFPRIKRENRYLLELENGSTVNFASAGVKSSKSSGVLGRSSGINFVHASEMCSWDNVEGLESFKNALAEDFPDRLYIWESTARGFNQWHDMWTEAKEDSAHQVTIFLGWWAKDNQVIRRKDPDFERYGVHPPTEKELKKIREVKELYDWDITPEQLAWIRRKMDPTAKAEGDTEADHEGTPLRIQEQPWTEDDAFQMTGATFFEPEDLTKVTNQYASKKYKTYSYSTGVEFIDCRVYPAHNAKSVQLKVWEEPDDEAVYVLAADVAFGSNEKNDRSTIQVLRCYSDGLDQVAEYAWPLVTSKQFAWVIASLLGWYGAGKAEVYLILEINGPGEATWNELQSLKTQISYGYQKEEIEERGLRRVFNNVRNYLYTRSDAMSPGRSYQWKTTTQLKVAIMERLRDFTSNMMLRIQSIDTIEEMRSITRDGDSIAAQGAKKDDRVMGLAMGVRYWDERVRKNLMGQRRTRESELAKRRQSIVDQANLYNSNQLTNFFAVKQNVRRRQAADARKAAWRARR